MSKVAVRVREVPVPATSHPEINVYLDGNITDGVCTTSQISWYSKDLIRGLNVMFGVKDHEEITSITVDEAGIRARIEPRRKSRG